MNDHRLSLLLALPSHKISYFNKLLLDHKIDCETFAFPVIQLQPEDIEIEEDFVRSFDWIIFTSSYGAEAFFLKTNIHQKDLKVATVGPSVSSVVKENNFSVSLQSNIFNSQSLAKELKEQDLIQGNKFLLVTGNKSNSQVLIKEIQNNKGHIEQLIVYKSLPESNSNWVNLSDFIESSSSSKLVCLSSPEGVKSFHSIIDSKGIQLPNELELVCLGPATQQTASQLLPKLKSHCPEEYSYNGMIGVLKT